MARDYIDETVTKTVTTQVSKTCDICGHTVHGRRVVDDEWSEQAYHKEQVTVVMDSGDVYPDNGFGSKLSFDICPECFRTRLVPFLQSLGAVPYVESWEY